MFLWEGGKATFLVGKAICSLMCIYFTISKIVSGAVLLCVCASICLFIINKEERASRLHFRDEGSLFYIGNENVQVYFSGCALPCCCGQKTHNPIIYTKSPLLLKAQYTSRMWLSSSQNKRQFLKGEFISDIYSI